MTTEKAVPEYYGYDRSDLKKIVYLDPSHLLPKYISRYEYGRSLKIEDVMFNYIRSGVRQHMRNWINRDYSIVFRDKEKGKSKLLIFNKKWDEEDD